MGYTHYFSQSKAISNAAWAKIKKDAQIIIKDQLNSGVPLEANNETGVMISENEINLNGVNNNSHETFSIPKQKFEDFNFCKTNNKPYDLAVTAILLLIEKHAPNHFNISSDGGVEGFLEAAKLNYKLFEYGHKLPKSMKNNEEARQHNKYFDSLIMEKKLKKIAEQNNNLSPIKI